MLRALRSCTLSVVAVVALAGCGSESSAAGDAVKADSAGATTIDITFEGGQVTPQGAKIQVKAGKPVTFHIVADKPGELHVHSSPEQEYAYPAGTTDKTLTLDQPGVVDVESHTLDKLVAQLEVR